MDENILSEFAQRERLRIRRDECGDPVIKDRYGCFDDNHDGRLGVVLIGRPNAFMKNRLKALCCDMDPVCQVEGDTEAVFLTTPGRKAFLKTAIRALGVKRRRIPTEVQLQTLAKAREALARSPHKRQISTIGTPSMV